MERMEQNPVGFHLQFFRLDLNMFASPDCCFCLDVFLLFSRDALNSPEFIVKT